MNEQNLQSNKHYYEYYTANKLENPHDLSDKVTHKVSFVGFSSQNTYR